ncbi:hypothetical protein EDC30_101516 [Paucimonas lemoignei]|uniref:YeeE/YedE family protein n=1 Tax=Paucimonas lemoignei TaxID=29443 RepID=A0A4V2UJC5_PAULE|nr:DUF6691 family protein [Paucimonas lemoignei]TCS39560.1 hypothetical protein EDC30_101516 [Paucimonas lemoignei]
MNILFAFVFGLVFGLGLIVSGLANPAKVLGFLDLAGLWDPSLILVMTGGIAIGAVAFAIARQRARTLLGFPMQLPTARHIDKRLVGGSLMFGIGWGLAGICPGPSVILLGAGVKAGFVFVAAMLIGMAFFEFLERHRARTARTVSSGSMQ